MIKGKPKAELGAVETKLAGTVLSSETRHLEADRTFLAATQNRTICGNKVEASKTVQKKVMQDGSQAVQE